MKKFHLSHPMFKLFYDLTEEEVDSILSGVEHNFSKRLKVGKVKVDYSTHFDVYTNLVRYVGLNHEWIYKECDFHKNLSYGDVTLLLLKVKKFNISQNR